MTDRMNTTGVERALARPGEVFEYHREVEILIVGGAAGLLTGVLSPSRTTTDCDVMAYSPPNAATAVELAAEAVAEEIGLAPHWLNSDVQIRGDSLPVGWERRRVWVGEFGRLRVWAVSRLDLIAMKVLAGRDQDVEDLSVMRVRADETEFVRTYLDSLAGRGTPLEEITDARAILNAIEARL